MRGFSLSNRERLMTDSTPDLHPNNVAPFLAKKLAAPGVIVLLSHSDGTVQLVAHGVNHARANEMLSVGIYVNLDQHYDAVCAGLAGEGAAAQQQALDGQQAIATPNQE
jgi:hypothetical protein